MARKPPHKQDKTDNIKKSRPTSKKQELENIRAKVLQGKGNASYTAQLLGIARATLYVWMSENPEIKTWIEEAGEAQIDHVENKLFALIDRGEIAATLFFLKTKGKHRGYVERTEQATVEPIRLRIVEEVIEAETNGATQNGRSQNPTESGAA